MVMKWSAVCLVVAVAMFGCRCDTQDRWSMPTKPENPPPVFPPRPSKPVHGVKTRPLNPPKPQILLPPTFPVQPVKPQPPTFPQRPGNPQLPTFPQRPGNPGQPQNPQQPLDRWSMAKKPMDPPKPQTLLPPTFPVQPVKPQPPTFPQRPGNPGQPQNPQQPLDRWSMAKKPMDPPKPQSLQPPVFPQRPENPQRPLNPPNPPRQKNPTQETFQTCDVEEDCKVTCGCAGISSDECGAINCCFDGRRCFYGKAVTVQCTKDAQFIVVAATDATLPNLDLESITMLGGNDAPCNPVGTTSSFAVYQFPVTACGTIMREEPGVVIYENRMVSSYEVAVGPRGSITRDSYYELLFQCRYIGTSVEAVVIEVNLVPPPGPFAFPGPLEVALRLANGVCFSKGCDEESAAYSSYYLDADYPVTKILRESVFVEIYMIGRTDPNIVLTLDHCWTTSNPNPFSLPSWDLLIDGCPYQDDRYLSALIPVDSSSGLTYPSHYRRFKFQMFTFVDSAMNPLREQVFIHCSTAVCQPSSGVNCEPRCFRKRRDILDAVQKTSRTESKVVSSKGVIMSLPQST